ncbi:MAG: dihydrodipicolinate synthase family protein [Candidatus Bathyarchaeota archaeon]|nr:MAG: dihydrodipicolinate synthase family protein [Candidatus Bathyarchaeota archaeon]
MRFEPRGVNVALVTPFTRDNEVNEKALRDLVAFLIEKGVSGLVPVGTTGEFIYLSEEEREEVVETVVDEANGRVPVIAGTVSAEPSERSFYPPRPIRCSWGARGEYSTSQCRHSLLKE